MKDVINDIIQSLKWNSGDANINFFKRRVKSSFGFNLSDEEVYTIISNIEEGVNIMGEVKWDEHVNAYISEIRGVRVVVVYDIERRIPITMVETKKLIKRMENE